MAPEGDFPSARHQRKIVPYAEPKHPGFDAGGEAIQEWSRAKAANLNQYVIGFGEEAESEWRAAGLTEEPDAAGVRDYRLARVREQLRKHDYAGVLLFDPLNTRYAIDSTNMQVWCMHNATRFAFIATEGPVVLWDYLNCEHLSGYNHNIDEIRPAKGAFFFFKAGNRFTEKAEMFAEEVADLVLRHGGGNKRLAVDHCGEEGLEGLKKRGLSIHNGEEVMEHARSIKSEDEIRQMRRAVISCEAATAVMREKMEPGMTENRLWSILHAENIARGGEWIETRLLSSGPRTNPWFQECSARVIEKGDIVAFDTDLVGPYGVCVDISRTWVAGVDRGTDEQRAMLDMARGQIHDNMEFLKPGRSFLELGEIAKALPDEYMPNRYSCMYHGCGLCDEWPSIRYAVDRDAAYDGVIEAGMVICVESYVGRHGGREGVKLEDQVLITETGYELLSTYPHDPALL